MQTIPIDIYLYCVVVYLQEGGQQPFQSPDIWHTPYAIEHAQGDRNLVHKNYLCTKFARYLLRQAITSVNVTRECFAFVPMQDFTRPWTDTELYTKYGLTEEEKALIEAMIKPIE